MSRKYSTELFDLIHAMTGTEKRYFKRYVQLHGGKKSHVGRLFDAYCRQKVFDEAKLVKSEKYLTGFSQHKQYLFSMVLRALRSYHSNINRDVQVLGLLAEVAILRNMRQYVSAMSVLNKAMRVALKSENILQQLEILRRRDEIRFDARSPMPPEIVSRILPEEYSLIHRYEEFMCNRGYAREMYNRHYHEGETLRKLNMSSKRPVGFHALRYYLISQTAMALTKMNLKSACSWAMEHVRLVESNPDYISDYPHEYMKVLSSRMVIEDMLGRYDDCLRTITELRTLQANPKFRSKLRNYESHTFVYTYTGEINALVRSLRFDAAVTLIPVILRGLEKYRDTITPNEIKVLYQNFALIFLYTGNARGAFRIASKALNDHFDARKDLNTTLIIARLIALYERGDDQFLLRQLKKDSSLLMESGIASKLIPKFLELLKNLVNAGSARKRLKLMSDFLTVLNSRVMRNDKAVVSAHFEFEPWVRSKMEGSTVAAFLCSTKLVTSSKAGHR